MKKISLMMITMVGILIASASYAQRGNYECVSREDDSFGEPFERFNARGYTLYEARDRAKDRCWRYYNRCIIESCRNNNSRQDELSVEAYFYGWTGQEWCDRHFGGNLGGRWRCVDVDYGRCYSNVRAGDMVTCVRARRR
ncbi:MAG: hypothetical protein R3B45_06940 [Bdellovibrionota bacterium]